eukprot:1190215-Prymnesium_polylepis.1
MGASRNASTDRTKCTLPPCRHQSIPPRAVPRPPHARQSRGARCVRGRARRGAAAACSSRRSSAPPAASKTARIARQPTAWTSPVARAARRAACRAAPRRAFGAR